MTRAYLDMPEDRDTPGLEFVFLGPTWNGMEAPRATEAQFRAFIDAWRVNDPNGVWGKVTVDNDGNLVHHRSDVAADDTDYDDVFTRVGRTAENQPIYAIEGWVFYIEERA